MHYMNRQLVAAAAFRHEGQNLQPGDSFYASPVDADYLVRKGTARDAQPQVGKPIVPKVAQLPHEPVAAELQRADSGDAQEASETNRPETQTNPGPADTASAQSETEAENEPAATAAAASTTGNSIVAPARCRAAAKTAARRTASRKA